MPYNKVVLTQLAVWSYFLMEREKNSYTWYWVCWGVYPAWSRHLSWCGGRENCWQALAPTACGPLAKVDILATLQNGVNENFSILPAVPLQKQKYKCKYMCIHKYR